MKKLLLSSCVFVALGCSPSAPISNENIALVLEQSHTIVKAGESVTFTARATGTAGREEKIKWEAKGGDLESLNDMERYARVEYDKPGVYTVLASLYVDGTLLDQEQAVVRVDPLS